MRDAHCLSAVSTEMRITTLEAFSWSIALRIVAALRSRRIGAYAQGGVVVSVWMV